MKNFLLISLFINLLTLLSLFFLHGWVGQVIGVVGVFILPGWLLTALLFRFNTTASRAIYFVLIFCLGAFTVGFEVFLLTRFNVVVTKETIILTGSLISFVLEIIIYLQQKNIPLNAKTNHQSYELYIGLSIFMALGLMMFVLLHQPIIEERFTEFFISPDSLNNLESSGLFDVVIINHEKTTKEYTLMCKDDYGDQKSLTEVLLKAETQKRIGFKILGKSINQKKAQILLVPKGNIDSHLMLEISIGNCNSIKMERNPSFAN